MKVNKILLPFLAAILCLFTACNDDDIKTVIESPYPEGEGAYFSKVEKTTYTDYESGDGILSIPVYRTKTEAAGSVAITAELEEGAAAVFSVPTDVTFSAGSNVANLAIPYTGAEFKKTYSITLTVNDGTAYAPSKLSFKFTYADAEVWTVVSKNATFIENVMGAAFGVDQQRINNITVEKLEGSDIYRFKSVFDDDYVYNEPGDYKGVPRYITLDLETYSTANQVNVFVPLAPLGHDWGYGEFEFGSVAYNLNYTPDQYALGTYDAQKKSFDLGRTFLYLPAEGAFLTKASSILYLDPSQIKIDYANDYTWSVNGLIGNSFTSELGGSWGQTVLVAAEDKTLFALPDLYNDQPLYFNFDAAKGNISTPAEIEFQDTGIPMGDGFFAKLVDESCSFDASRNRINLAVDFYTYNATDDVYTLSYRTLEVLTLGTDPADIIKENATIDEFVGNWGAQFINRRNGSAIEEQITVTKVDDETLFVKGLSLMAAQGVDYDDEVVFTFDPESGLAEFAPQYTADYDVNKALTFVFNYYTGMNSLSATFLVGIAKDGGVVLFNSPENDYDYNCSGFFYIANSRYNFMSDYVAGMYWSEMAATTRSAAFDLTPFVTALELGAPALKVNPSQIKAQPVANGTVYSKSQTVTIDKTALKGTAIAF